MIFIIKKKEEEIMYNIFNNNYKPLSFFKDYGFATYNYTYMYENPLLVDLIQDYSRDPIRMRRGIKNFKKYKKHKRVWVPTSKRYYRSLFTTSKCKLNNINFNKFKKKSKINLLNFFFKMQKKRTVAYSISRIQKKDDFINEGDEITISFVCYKAFFKKIILHLNKNKRIIPDYKKIRRVAIPINFKFKFFDLHKNNQVLMFNFYGQGYEDCNLLITCNSYYIPYFEEFEYKYLKAVEWYKLLSVIREYNLYWNIYMTKYDFLFEFWKAYELDYWFRKYWDPDWPKIIGSIWSTIKYYAKEDIINTKRREKNVSREEAIRLVAESRERARAENIILKAQMKEKLAILEWKDDVKRVRKIIEEHKKKGINMDFVDGLKLVSIWKKEYAKETAEIIAMNQIIAKEMILEAKRNFVPKKRDLRIFKSYKR